ncbi:YdiU family protein [bacterium]|nr:YdiU family protein [bacterium]
MFDLIGEGSFAESLPADPARAAGVRQVQGATHSWVAPTPVSSPRVLAWSDAMGEVLGINSDQALPLLAGNAVPDGFKPYATCYGGHQFGNWAGQLGDGRAINLAEVRGTDGQRYEVQLKGAGPTPYSRTADGRAVLRSSLREFLCSEAMHALGVPTTRALSLVATGDTVVRDMFYDGNPAPEPGAIVCRVAPSFIRFGNFELPAVRGDHALLRQLFDYTVNTHWPDIDPQAPDAVERWFTDICRRTATLLAHWMRVGFVHGVMNTDNMSVHGLTIDYGPYGWLEPFDPSWTPNTTDLPGRRYCYGNQPAIAQWNLSRLGSALTPLVDDVQVLQDALAVFANQYTGDTQRQFGQKLGLPEDAPPDAVDALLKPLFDLLPRTEVDMTLFFRGLADVPTAQDAAEDALLAPVLPAYYDAGMLRDDLRADTTAWLRQWARAVHEQDAETRKHAMNAANPLYVPRNWLAQQAIDAAEQGNLDPLHRLQRVLAQPYTPQDGADDLAARRPEWARNKPGCSALSCSS